jgi:pimeloyl-ACP methyl ester carboxylesterase
VKVMGARHTGRGAARAGALVAAAMAVGLVVAGCTSVVGADEPPPLDPSQKAQAQKPPKPDLSKYYTQQLKWNGCEDGDQCARLTVPVDYAKPDGQTIELAVLKVPAKKQSNRIGSLVVNPGGPGGSGVQYASYADYIVSAKIRQVYDVVGFDPRGVGQSAPITCYDDSQMDTYLGADPTPDDKAEEQATFGNAEAFAKACGANAGPLLAHMSTEDAAKDMDVLRAALGEKKLTYLGKSYGTFLGATYAGLFPEKVGRFVLDGVVPPDLTGEQMDKGQAEGFERATRAYVEDCVNEGDCPLGDSVDAGMNRLRDFLAQLDAHPLPVKGDARVTKLTEGWGSMGVAAAMYDQGSWGILTDALSSAFKGDGTPLMQLADQYAERNSNGSYSNNMMQSIYAVNCMDRPGSDQLSDYEARAKSFSAVAPTWGDFLAWGSVPCGFWPVQPDSPGPHKITAKGSGPILVLGTTRDPATPYEWSVRLAKQLANGHLVTFNGDGHTAYMRSNACVDNAVDAYLLDDTVPPSGKKC